VKLAALQGLFRHCYASTNQQDGTPLSYNSQPVMSDEDRAKVVALLTTWAKMPSPTGRNPSAHAWMREVAVNSLAALKQPGANGEIAKTLVEIVSNPDEPLEVRLVATRALGALIYTKDGKPVVATITPIQLTAPVVAFINDCLDIEKKRPAPLRSSSMTAKPGMSGMPGYGGGYPGGYPSGSSSRPPSGGSYPSMPGMPGMGGEFEGEDPDADRLVQFRRLFKRDLAAVRVGLIGTTGTTAAPAGLAGFAAAAKDDKALKLAQLASNAIQKLVNTTLDAEDADFATMTTTTITGVLNDTTALLDTIPGAVPAAAKAAPKVPRSKPAPPPAEAPPADPGAPAAAPKAPPAAAPAGKAG
jgi:hypothetical protein